MTATIHHGDCLDVLRAMPDNSVHAIVTDPPYGLSNTTPEQVADTIVKWVSGDREYLPSARGFMGKEWDGFVPPVAVWDEAMRVLKPGGHVLAFAGSRTHDLMTLGLRLAGFDIRDSVYWHYGSGMPKSHDIGKAIDKMAPRVGMFTEFATHYEERRKAAGMTHGQVCELGKFYANVNHGGASVNWGKGHNVPTREQWAILAPALDLSDEWLPLIERVEAEREVTGKHLSGLATGTSGVGGFGEGKERRDNPATTAARKWSGWGTALKPATEPIVLARKPFPGKTVAANVLEHGTGGLNIDACRIPTDEDRSRPPRTPNAIYGGGNGTSLTLSVSNPSGRWPANVILDEHMAGVLDQMSGNLPTQKPRTSSGSGETNGIFGFGSGSPHNPSYAGEQGGASRFFYVAEQDAPFMYAPKAPKKERPDVAGVKHPTVKPLSIMSWLVRLVTPPNGIVLDPFAGSGTTIEAAMLEGFQVIGIEREAEYLPLIHHRIDRVAEQLKTEQQQQAEAPDQGAFPLEDIA